MKEQKQLIQAYDAYADAIFRHCYIRVSNREKAKDITQDTFMRTWEYIVKGNDIKNIHAFLFRVANNLIIDTYRKKKDLSLDELREQGFDPGVDDSKKTADAIDARSVIITIDKLDEKYKEVVLLRFVDEFSPKEIAKIVGESENTVSVRIHRGIAELRKIIGTQ